MPLLNKEGWAKVTTYYEGIVVLIRNFHTVKLNSLHVSVFTKTFWDQFLPGFSSHFQLIRNIF
jgi:hypothetical protein